MFHVWALDRGRPRPQTIQAHVIQFSLHVLANTIGACTRFAIEHGDSNPGPGTTTTFVSIVQVLVEVAIEPGYPPHETPRTCAASSESWISSTPPARFFGPKRP